MFTILFERWAKSSQFSPQEMRMLQMLLPATSVHSANLLAQAARAPYVERKAAGPAAFEATIPYVEDESLLVENDADLRSPEIEVTDVSSGRSLRFFTEVVRGGFLRGLSGYAPDGHNLPRNWRCDFEASRIPREVESWLDNIPPPLGPLEKAQIIDRLTGWAGVPKDWIGAAQREALRMTARASELQIRECERRLNLKANSQYKELVTITNGFGIRRGRPYDILGTSEVQLIEQSGSWVGVTPLYEEGYIAMKVSGGFFTEVCFLLSSDGEAVQIGDLKTHVRNSLVREVT